MHPMIIRGLAKIESELQQQLLQAYELFDNRNKGFIDANGLSEAMKVLGYQIDKKQIQDMLASLGSSGNKNAISREQFKKFMTARLDYRDDQGEIRKAFEYIDGSKKGKISEKDLKKLAEQIGQKQEQCARMVYEADKDQDGFINQQQFLRVIKKTSYF